MSTNCARAGAEGVRARDDEMKEDDEEPDCKDRLEYAMFRGGCSAPVADSSSCPALTELRQQGGQGSSSFCR